MKSFGVRRPAVALLQRYLLRAPYDKATAGSRTPKSLLQNNKGRQNDEN
ncbi:MAG TPA: hypothetical protein VGP85_00290 [Pyrinomonadaceae bacterium]|nr:hypothetical protein [Pyrinomonadaceae bacterium]